MTAVESERSPQGGRKAYVTVLVLRIRFLPFPASHPLAKLQPSSVAAVLQQISDRISRLAVLLDVPLSFLSREVIRQRR